MVKMFPNNDNKPSSKSGTDIFFGSNFDLGSTECIADALKIYLNYKNSRFNHQHFLQNCSTIQGTQMCCSYADIAMV